MHLTKVLKKGTILSVCLYNWFSHSAFCYVYFLSFFEKTQLTICKTRKIYLPLTYHRICNVSFK
uniref:Uncharacterized protein n=1 Tax=Anguilla anguilla TaxID=7936 RepID=A0A0E9TZ71_ANGAN